MNVRRSLLFMPGDSRKKIEKGATLGADSLIMDLEDGVALNAKETARAEVAAALREIDFGYSEKLVRINPVIRSQFPEADIAATIDSRPHGYVIPKVEAAWQVAQVAERISAAERHNNWEEGSIILLALLETTLGIVNAREIAENSPRLVALIFGAEDLAGDLGAIRTPGGMEVLFARQSVVLHAKAFGLQAIDTPYLDLANVEGLSADTSAALHMGYTGKLAIHPRQIEPINTIFTPTDEQIAAALRVIQAHEEHQAAGAGVFALDGKMVDMPVVLAAETVIARAKAAGKV